jgi:phosphoglycolate phosphatase
MHQNKLLIFDLDGTLLNTYEDLGNAVNYVLEKNNFPTYELILYKTFVGNGIDNLLRKCLPPDFSNEKHFQEIRADFVQNYEAHKFDRTHPYEGIMDLLRELNSSGIKLAVASNKYHKATVELVERYFSEINWEVVFGHRENKPKKPDPTIVFDILEISQTSKEETLYIGDSSVDMKTASNAGVKSIGVTWGFRTEEELRTHQADFIVHHPGEILGII